jgi:hypothetical protein
VKKWLVAALTLAALGWELVAAYDHDPGTWPLTWIIRAYVPWWIYWPATILLGAFLIWHFSPANRGRYPHKETTTMGFAFEPVKWMTWLLTTLTALSSVPLFMAWLPPKISAGLLVVIAVLTAVLGALVRNKVTPLARPRDEDGRILVPAGPARTAT